jgi:hypothetical protein
MIESKYIKGVAVPEFDGMLSKFVDDYDFEGGGKSMRVGVENFDKKVYRVLTSSGMRAFLDVIECFQTLKMKDQLANSPSSKDGLDALFTPTGENQKIAQDASEPIHSAADDIVESLSDFAAIPETQRQSLIQSRVGQGVFRQKLIDYWQGCAVTGSNFMPALRASHIKPWRASTNEERLDVNNGLLLSPNLDAAFDLGHITFDAAGKIIMSTELARAGAYQLHISQKMRISQKLLTKNHLDYLEYHRREVFRL